MTTAVVHDSYEAGLAPAEAMTPAFRRFAGWAALCTATIGVVYTVTFALYVREGYHWAQWASAIALTAGGLLTTPVLVGLRARLGAAEPQFAGLALVIGLVGALGATIHGAYDVAVLAKPVRASADLPSQIDPRGFLTFALTGVALGLFGWLALRTGALPRATGYAGIAATALLLVVYFGRLIVLDPNRDIVRIAAVVVGLVVLPAFYVGVARAFLSGERG
jgi:hypothetical protein